jgi:putative flippase GtrA
MTQAKEMPQARLAWERTEALTRFFADLVKYGFASAMALMLDYGLLILLNKFYGIPYLAAAAIGFAAGLGLIYILSVYYVFSGRRRLSSGPELLGFLVTGAIGLLLNEALMGFFVETLLLSVPLAKVPTAGFVFMFNFLARRAMLFTPETKVQGRRR